MTKKKLRMEIKENATDMYVTVPKPSMRYIDEWLTMRCAADMQQWGLFPNAKEIQESFAAYRAARYRVLRGWHRGQAALGDSDIGVICIGDGNTPRTGATFAMRSRWPVVSIDPALKVVENWHSRVQRLRCFTEYDYKLTREEMGGIKSHLTGVKGVILVYVHSHAQLVNSIELFAAQVPVRGIITNPCCVPHDLERVVKDFNSRGFAWGYEEYEDWGIWSPQRTVKVAWWEG